MSANKPKQQEVNRKPGQDQDELGKGRTPGEPSEQQYDESGQDKNKDKNKGGDSQTR